VKGVRVASFWPIFPVDRSNPDFSATRSTGNVSDRFGLMEEQNDKDRKEHDLSLV
jgi:hypothetical protein